jgi:hypothetical protein
VACSRYRWLHGCELLVEIEVEPVAAQADSGFAGCGPDREQLAELAHLT